MTEHYEITTQQQNFVESVALYRTKEVEVQGDIFRFAKVNKGLYFGFIKRGGFFIAAPEKAFLDAAYLASLSRYRFDLTAIDAARLDKGRLKSMLKKFPALTGKYLESYGFLKKA